MRHTSTASSGVRHLTVHASPGSVDLVLSARVPVEALIPTMVDVLEVSSAGPVPARFQLSSPGGAALDTSKTFDELGIRDGATLYLVRSSTELQIQHCDDVAEAVSAAVAAIEQRWTRRAAQLIGTLMAVGSTGVSAAVLIRADVDGIHHAGCVGVAAAISLVALLAAVVAYRVAGSPDAGLALGLIAIAFATLFGLLAVPDRPGAPNTLLAAAAAMSFAACLRVIACHTVIFTTLSCFSLTCGVAAALCMLVATSLPVIGAALAAVSLAVIEASAPASVLFTRLSSQQTLDVPAADQWQRTTMRAHHWLASLISAFSASAATGALSVLFGATAPDLAFATVIGSLLLLRSRAHRDLGRSLPPMICGAVTLGAMLVAVAVKYPNHTLYVVCLTTALGIGALYLGFTSGPTMPSPAWRRSVEVVEYVGFAAVVPLTFWLCGLFGAVRSVNLS